MKYGYAFRRQEQDLAQTLSHAGRCFDQQKEDDKPSASEERTTQSCICVCCNSDVFERGRLTVPPQRALDICGPFLATTSESPTELCHMGARTETTELATDCHEWTQGEIESYKKANLPMVRLVRGWDAVRELFQEEEYVLAKYGDLMW